MYGMQGKSILRLHETYWGTFRKASEVGKGWI